MWQRAREAATRSAEGGLQSAADDCLSIASDQQEEGIEYQSSGSTTICEGTSISAPSRARSAERVMLSCSAAFACADAVPAVAHVDETRPVEVDSKKKSDDSQRESSGSVKLKPDLVAGEAGRLATKKKMEDMALSGKNKCTIPAAPRSIPIRGSAQSSGKSKRRGIRRPGTRSSSPSKVSSEGERERRSPFMMPFMQVPPPPPPGDDSGPVVIVGVATDWQGRLIRR